MSNGYNAPGAVLVANLWWYAYSVLRPAQILKPYGLGLYRTPEIGSRPFPQRGADGAGQRYCIEHPEPVYLDERPESYSTVDGFDQLSSNYDRIIEPFSRPIFEEVVAAMRPFMTPRSRILDPSCGPGTEAVRLASMVPQGEIVASDLSAGMVSAAAANARQHGVRNMAFFQADVTALPQRFDSEFDVIYCSLAFHHYPDAVGALREMRRVLRPGGAVFISDAGPWWMKALASPLASWADPGWVTFRTGEEFRELFAAAGFGGFYWTEVLPGIGLSIGTR
jgi:ubiquinone/menaquinone biosynthesis C-methylase UbiE